MMMYNNVCVLYDDVWCTRSTWCLYDDCDVLHDVYPNMMMFSILSILYDDEFHIGSGR